MKAMREKEKEEERKGGTKAWGNRVYNKSDEREGERGRENIEGYIKG